MVPGARLQPIPAFRARPQASWAGPEPGAEMSTATLPDLHFPLFSTAEVAKLLLSPAVHLSGQLETTHTLRANRRPESFSC